jgi:hypothetical protein
MLFLLPVAIPAINHPAGIYPVGNLPARPSPSGPAWTLFSVGAGADQAQRNNVAALAIISSIMMRLNLCG